MARYDYDLAVIGGGAAGLTITAGAAQLGVKTLLIEQENLLGGDCLHYGCVPSKALLKSASVYHAMRSAQDYGLPPVQLDSVDFSRITERIAKVIATVGKHDSIDRFTGLGAEVLLGTPCFKDEHTVACAGKRITAATWVIATGSRSAPPAAVIADAKNILTHKELFSLDRLPQSLTVLGAGPIAVEMAQAFARLGSEVTIVQRSEQILSREDADMAAVVMKRLEEEGVRIVLAATVQKMEQGPVPVLHVQTNDGVVQLAGEKILLAQGRVANVEGLGLEGLGIEYSSQGIVTDQRLRTAQSHIYAAGDVLGQHLFTHAAGYEGSIVLANAVFRLPRKVDYTWLPWCTYTEPALASIGLNEKRAQAQGLEYTVWEESFADNDRAVAGGEDTGRIKLILNRKKRPLGVQIVGPFAGDLIGEWIGVLNGGIKLSTLAGSIHPYPTLTEISKRVTGKVLAEKLFSPTVKTLLKLLFRYQGKGRS